MIRFSLLLIFFTLSAHANDFVSVCDRAKIIREELEKQAFRSCTKIDAQILAETKELVLHQEDGLQFRSSDFAGLENLNRLVIITARRSEIPNDAFRDLKSLTELGLYTSQTEILEGTLAPLTKLKSLSLSGISSLPKNFFETLPLLEHFSIDRLGDSLWPKLARQTKLRELYLFKSGITYLDNSVLAGMKDLEILMVGSNPGLTLDVNTFAVLPNLKELTISNLNISRLSAELGYVLRNLTTLDVGTNPITEINPKFFAQLTKLEKLDLGETNISTIHAGAFDASPNLKTLILSGCDYLNRIEDFAFVNLTKLETVLMMNSPLRDTRKAAFYGLPDILKLPSDFDQDNDKWGGE